MLSHCNYNMEGCHLALYFFAESRFSVFWQKFQSHALFPYPFQILISTLPMICRHFLISDLFENIWKNMLFIDYPLFMWYSFKHYVLFLLFCTLLQNCYKFTYFAFIAFVHYFNQYNLWFRKTPCKANKYLLPFILQCSFYLSWFFKRICFVLKFSLFPPSSAMWGTCIPHL